MKNLEVSFILRKIADLAELKGENIYKVRAYRNAADAIKHLDISIEEIYRKGELLKVPGVGKNIAKKIEEIINTGTCDYYEKLKQEIPMEFERILKIPGLGPNRARILLEKLNIKSTAQLKKAAKHRKIRKLKGFGPKIELSILRHLELQGQKKYYKPRYFAMPIAAEFMQILEAAEDVQKVAIVGSLRRKKDMVQNINLLIKTRLPLKEIQKVLEKISGIENIVLKQDVIIVETIIGINLHIHVCYDNYYSLLQYFTGSKSHNLQLKEQAKSMGLNIQDGVIVLDNKQGIEKESDIYRALKLQYIPPELREGRGEVEAAIKGRLPELIKLNDIKGDLHLHSDWSDGINTIEELTKQAEKMGYEYIAITDHSKSLKIAGGLAEKDLIRQQKHIKELNKRMKDITVLSGIEVDIMRDGSLDYSNEILEKMDVVIASIHTGFKQDRYTLTKRVINAIENEHVDIIAHPTGRLLGRRQPYNIDIEAVFKAAITNNKILEINASPDRLDLKDTYCQKAKKMGIKMVINTDAHEKSSLYDMEFGVENARRGWLEKSDIINTYPLKELQQNFLRKNHHHL